MEGEPITGDTQSETEQKSSHSEAPSYQFEQANHACRIFMSTLNQIEQNSNVELMACLFAENTEIWRQAIEEPYRGIIGARRFWKEYVDQFEHIYSRFVRVTAMDRLVVLEWVSEGAVKGGRAMHYAGVSLLEMNADEKITSFRSYFDSAQFLTLLPHTPTH